MEHSSTHGVSEKSSLSENAAIAENCTRLKVDFSFPSTICNKNEKVICNKGLCGLHYYDWIKSQQALLFSTIMPGSKNSIKWALVPMHKLEKSQKWERKNIYLSLL